MPFVETPSVTFTFARENEFDDNEDEPCTSNTVARFAAVAPVPIRTSLTFTSNVKEPLDPVSSESIVTSPFWNAFSTSPFAPIAYANQARDEFFTA